MYLESSVSLHFRIFSLLLVIGPQALYVNAGMLLSAAYCLNYILAINLSPASKNLLINSFITFCFELSIQLFKIILMASNLP